jgi:hypothetical protein
MKIFACFTSETGKITVPLKGHVILLVSEVKQAKVNIRKLRSQWRRRGHTWIPREPPVYYVLIIKHIKTLVRTKTSVLICLISKYSKLLTSGDL